MVSGRSDFQRALCRFLPLDIGKIRQCLAGKAHGRIGRRQHLRPAEMIGECDQASRRENIDIGARPCRLRPAGMGADQALFPAIGAYCSRKNARNRRDGTIKRQFASTR